MITVEFYDTTRPGQADELLGSISLERTGGHDTVVFAGPEQERLRAFAEGLTVPVFSDSGVVGRATLRDTPACWLRNVHTEFRSGYSYVKHVADDGREPDEVDKLLAD